MPLHAQKCEIFTKSNPALQVTLSNLDLIIQESRSQFEQLLPHILEDLERQWCHRFPRATAACSIAGKLSCSMPSGHVRNVTSLSS